LLDQADLHKECSNGKVENRRSAVDLLATYFSSLSDKALAWQDLIRLNQDEDHYVRWRAAYALETALRHAPDASQVWKDLIILTQDERWDVQESATDALVNAIPYVPDKISAWQDIIRMTQDEKYHVSHGAADALVNVFPYIPDKYLIWHDLHRLTRDEKGHVRSGSARALSIAFPHIPEKDLALKDLVRLTEDEDWTVRGYAYYSLGRASVFRAAETRDNDEFKYWLEKAIKYFSRSEGISFQNSASFCLPFYKALYGLLFLDKSTEEELQKYLIEAKNAVGESESKGCLLLALESLYNALNEVRSYTVDEIIKRSKGYTRFCIQAAESMEEVRSKNPYASKVIDAAFVKRSIPIIDKRIKDRFTELEEAAKSYSRKAKGTSHQDLADCTYEKAKIFQKAESPIDVELLLDEFVPLLNDNINLLPKQSRGYLEILVKSMNNATMEKRIEILKAVFMSTLEQLEDDANRLAEYEDLLGIFRNIEHTTSRLLRNSGDTKNGLLQIQTDLKALQKLANDQDQNIKQLGIDLDEKEKANIERMERMRIDLLHLLETIILQSRSVDEKTREILERIREKKKINLTNIISISADVIQIGSFFVPHCIELVTKAAGS
jgi:HEAT repeat protein